MSEENSKLTSDINELKKKLEQFERQNAELMRENAKLKEKDIKSIEEIEMLKKDKLQISIPILQLHHSKRSHEEGCGDLALKNDSAKKSKQFEHSIPNWFLDALDWIKRTELAQSSLSFSSKTFNQICFPKLHGNVKPHKVGYLEFSHSWDEEGNSRSILQKYVRMRTLIPIASINPPKYITGFERIDFNFIDSQALEFVQGILPMLNDISINFQEWRGNDVRLGPIDRLMALLGPKTYHLELPVYITTNGMDYLDEQLPGFLNNVRSIGLDYCRNSADMNVLSNWLATPRKDGQKKLLNVNNYRYDANGFADKVKEEFFDSEKPSNFIVSMDEEDLVPFRMENERKDEILELYQKQNLRHYLIRHRKGDDVDKIDWEEEFEKISDTLILIRLIGDLLECHYD